MTATENTEYSESKVQDDLTHRIIGAAIEVHRTLGPGLLESIYEEALCHECYLQRIPVERQVAIDVVYKGTVIKGQRIDIVVDKQVVIEIKSLSKVPDLATAQILSYLKATGIKRGLIINFGARMLRDGIKRVSL